MPRFDLGLGSVWTGDAQGGVTFEQACYADMVGLADLRAAIAQREQLTVDKVVVTAGASMGLTSVLALLPAGREVLTFAPYYPPYPGLCDQFGLDLRTAPLQRGKAPRPDMAALRDHVTDRTAAILWNFPHNPTGAVADAADLAALGALARDTGALVIADEVYRDLWFGAPPADIADHVDADSLVRLRSFSKGFQLAGERVGYALAPAGLAEATARRHWRMAMSVSATAQRLALGALQADPDTHLAQLRGTLRRNRDLAVAALERFGIATTAPHAGVFLWLDLADLDPHRLFETLANHELVVMPGGAFGPDHGGWIRCAFGLPTDEVSTAFARLGAAVAACRAPDRRDVSEVSEDA